MQHGHQGQQGQQGGENTEGGDKEQQQQQQAPQPPAISTVPPYYNANKGALYDHWEFGVGCADEGVVRKALPGGPHQLRHLTILP